ncbi:flavodoxin [Caloranaerobacter azorensis]|uniref:Flavodoxin n=2 Tax=Caloranaerobacter azorensis TaxID=116090 RepID=A0A096BHK7_9FIRM|nr:flavodoxin [Caloranaerobacter azorensis]KGG80660.1 flavodoxin [Caloranaerobacter azorensis H53214]QIB27639.1 flavodoxin [Caloranaerobacter azorensis]
MKKLTIIYWSGTGNTEMMADAIAEGARTIGGDVEVVRVEDANKDMVINSDALAFGCPSMGVEVLEEQFMEPFIESLRGIDFSGKKVALFGSYDWGDGEWMRNWVERMKEYGANLINEEGLIIRLTPDEEGINACKALGEQLVKE